MRLILPSIHTRSIVPSFGSAAGKKLAFGAMYAILWVVSLLFLGLERERGEAMRTLPAYKLPRVSYGTNCQPSGSSSPTLPNFNGGSPSFALSVVNDRALLSLVEGRFSSFCR